MYRIHVGHSTRLLNKRAHSDLSRLLIICVKYTTTSFSQIEDHSAVLLKNLLVVR